MGNSIRNLSLYWDFIVMDIPVSFENRFLMFSPSGQNSQRNSLKECVFVNSSLKIQNTLLQTAFSAILPTKKETSWIMKVFIVTSIRVYSNGCFFERLLLCLSS